MAIDRNILLLVLIAMGLVIGIAAYQIYLSERLTYGVEIDLDDTSVFIPKQ